jgi:serine/threonine protein kinase/Flp pilus assembly protein TadD
LAEDLLGQHPELDDEAAVRLVFEEFCLREELGEPADPADVVRRFPHLRDEIEVLLDCHRLIESSSTAVFPQAGEEFAGYRLLSELGRGASGKVFLAEQPSLADRPVVLKVTTRGHDEHLSLARLQHMNIIPLYTEQVLPERNLRLLCMPYLGGATLAQILDLLGRLPPRERTGRQVLEAIDKVQAARPVALSPQGPFRQALARASYVDALCWIGACLADGLQYAHDRGLVHMDIKPSNVLLTADGQPMLLDFHLTRGPIAPGGPAPLRLGGTPEYLSPEQWAAMTAIRAGRTDPPVVDGRADIYSLGIVLYEALGSQAPTAGGAARPPLRRLNPAVPVGVADILERCLRADPDERYRDATSLSADLRRHLSDLPLRGVANRSLGERWRKWRRRQPRALTRNVSLAIAVVAAVLALVLFRAGYDQRLQDIQSLHQDGKSALARHQFPQAIRTLTRALAVAERTPYVADRETIAQDLARARRAEKAAELHALVDLVRFRYGLDPPPADEARTLLSNGQTIWDARRELIRPVYGPGELEVERTLHADLLDFAVVWANVLARSATAQHSGAGREQALRILDEAQALLGPSPALERDRRVYAGAPDSSEVLPAPRTAWEHYHMGRSYLRSGEIERAAGEFSRALGLRRQDFWPNFYQGLCAYRLGRFDEAEAAFRVCIALAPDTAECYYNHALALAALDRLDAADADYALALQRNAGLAEAALNRGILQYKAARYPEARENLLRALDKARDPVLHGAIQYNLALVHLACGDRPAALRSLETAKELGHAEAAALARRISEGQSP